MYYTGEQLYRIVQHNIDKIPHDIKGVIAIARGGLFPGFIIAEHFNIPITTVDKFIEDINNCWFNESTFIKFNSIDNGKLLVIDDSVDTGNSLRQTINKLNNINNFSFVYAVIHSTVHIDDLIVLDDNVESTNRCYEFNLFRTFGFNNCICDIDGVLCKDPEWGLDTKENEYIYFLNNAKPYLHVPNIDIVLTSRIEKYRTYTENWLSKNNIKYNKLIMSPLNSIDEKLYKMSNEGWCDALWKTEQYKSICKQQNKIPIMIESNEWDANYIKQKFNEGIIFCTDTNMFIQ